MKFCSNCGTRLKDEAKFCPNCGTSCNDDAPGKAQGTVQEKPVKYDIRRPAPSKERTDILSIISLCLGIGALIFCVICFITCASVSCRYYVIYEDDIQRDTAFRIIGLVIAIAGVILSGIGISKSRKSTGTANKMAVTGLILSIASVGCLLGSGLVSCISCTSACV